MTIHRFSGFAIGWDQTGADDVAEEFRDLVTLTVAVPDNQTTFSYSLLPSDPGEIPEVDISSNDFLTAFNDISADELVSGGDNITTFLGEIEWGAGNVTQLLIVEISDGPDFRTDLIFRLGGDALPTINSQASFDAFVNTITDEGAISGSSPFGPGKNIPWTSLLDRETFADNPINGTAGSDTINGTAGNDLINTDTNGGNGDILNASLGDDFYVLSGSQAGDYYDFFYDSGSFSSIELTLDADWAEAYVDKYNGANLLGTDQLIDLHRAAFFETGDGVYFKATSGDDVFNINMDDSTWIGVNAQDGDDTFNISSNGGIVRIDYRGAGAGITANLNTGLVQDGRGGTDQINVTNGSGARVEIHGTDNNDNITGSGRNERFILGEGNDTLDAGNGWDALRYDRSNVGAVTVNLATGTATGTWNGNVFTHTISNVEEVRGSRNDSDSITGDGNNNWFRGHGGDDTLNGGGGNDTLVGEDGDDVLNGGAGADVAEFWINRADATITQVGGNVTVVSSLGTDVLTGVETLRFNDQDVIINASGATAGPDTLTGTAGDDSIDGLGGNDSISGLGGNDDLRGSGGNDTLLGGNGRDTLRGGEGNDLLNPGDNDQDWDLLEPGAGNDTVDFGQMQLGGGGIYHWSLTAGIVATINGNSNTGTINKGVNGTTTILDVANPMTDWGFGIQGTGFNDTYNMTVLDDGWASIENSAGNDTINIGASTGALRLDYRMYDTPVSGVNANLATGIIQDGYGGTDTVTGINQIDRFEIRLSDETDTVLGSARGESFILREGNDTLDAGGGRDLLRYDRSNVDAVNVNLNTGTATGTWNGNAFTHTIRNVEKVRGSRDDNDTLIGNGVDNLLDGRGGNDSLIGLGGADTLEGEDGNDTLRGGDGNDIVADGSGDDLVFGGNGNDEFTWGTGADTFDGGAGNDTLSADIGHYAQGDFVLEANLSTGQAGALGSLVNRDALVGIENVILSNAQVDAVLTGNSSANVLTSNAGNDTLNGLGGNDLLNGGAGNDTLLGGDQNDTLNGNQGADSIEGGNGRDLSNMGDGNDLFVDNAQTGDAGRDTVYGNAGNDTILGGGGNDLFNGQNGNDSILGGNDNDTLLGGAGADTLKGGNGNDSVRGDNGRDRVELGGGNDRFSDNGQNTADGADTVFGGGGNDTIIGGGGADSMLGGDGNDSVTGGKGNDKLFGGSGNDTLKGNEGNDSVDGGNGRDRAELGSGNDVFNDNNQGGTFGQDTVLGQGGNDTINGGAGNDRFEGQDGNDLVRGGGGNDLVFGGNQNDTLYGGDGNDTVAGGNGRDRAFLGNGNDSWFDNAQSAFGEDSVFGGAGNDTIHAGGGNDTLGGGSGVDVFIFADTIDDDTVTDYEVDIDALQISATLWNGALTQTHLDALTTVSGGNLVFTFDNGDTLTLEGITSTMGLLDDISLL